MNKDLEKLIQIKFDNKHKYLRKYLIVKVLEDFEKRINKLEEKQGVLVKKVKKIEQHASANWENYYPMTEEEIRNCKVGGTD